MRTSISLGIFIGLVMVTSLIFWKFQLFTFDGYTLHMTSVEGGVWAIFVLLWGLLREVEDDAD